MANRSHSARRIKRLRSYNVAEAAKATGATPGTIRHWQKHGLDAVPGLWPLLFRGVDIIAFFDRRKSAKKQACGPGRMFCLRCKSPKVPALNMADYRADTPRLGVLTGLCPDCAGLMYRRTSPAKLKGAAGNLDIQMQPSEPRLTGMAEPNSNHHSGRGA